MAGSATTSDPYLEGVSPQWLDVVEGLASWLETAHAGNDSQARELAPQIAQRLGDAGLVAAAVTPGADRLRACCLIRRVLAYRSPLADAVFALQALGSRPMLLAAGEELKAEWLPTVESGQAVAAFAMTEPGAGSDVASLSTEAVRDGDEYVVNGGKTFISNAGIADFYSTFVRTGTRDDGRAAITCLLIRADTPGCEFVEAQQLADPHPLGTIEFNDCRVPVANRLGGEGEGFRIGMQTLDLLRPTVAAAACGMAARALDEAVSHARGRQQFGKPLAEFQLIQAKLADMATELEAAWLLTLKAAWLADTTGAPNTLASAQAKLYATEAAQRIIDQAV